MFVGGIADGFLLMLAIIAALIALLGALGLTLLLRQRGKPWGQAIAWGFGITCVGFLGLLSSLYLQSNTTPVPQPSPVEIDMPRASDKSL